ncbi:tRNA1(Val) (adenine(37)-N6)-methyltransferase [Paracoccus haematequi]|uniref:tRNA1(Val) (Adenine(37)-N6)-methyltransferase n=1 Tax=Paracoccus haematequi TaxID=2491866 RepID=A0A3S4GKY5_9RHOB|nr:methyltransferase [Paracoccus haematequi]VDS07118.1 tRNA1(Val) (adenine(37)-N6)-methyltransferase [Paracoccus haematequi]
MSDLSDDGFLDGRLRVLQPRRGFRSGADAVMLAAACPAAAGQAVLELGCGAGVASLCLGWRVADLRLAGLERQPDYADLARRNAAANGIAMQVLTGDVALPPAALRAMAFDHVIANPPYFLGGTPAPDGGRALARQEQTPLAVWIDAGLRRLRPGGVLTLIQRADRLDAMLEALSGRAGSMAILPIAGRAGREAGRVILRAQKGGRGPLRLLAPFVMHRAPAHPGDREDLTPAASAVLREGLPLTTLFAKVS